MLARDRFPYCADVKNYLHLHERKTTFILCSVPYFSYLFVFVSPLQSKAERCIWILIELTVALKAVLSLLLGTFVVER